MVPYRNMTITLFSLLISFMIITIFLASPSVSSLTSADGQNDVGVRIKKTTQVFLNSRHNKNLEKVVLYKSKSKKAMIMDARPRFSAMLPKGYVAPSRSSTCHNLYRNSVTFFCELSAAEMREP